jgi:hypothetical protein
MGDVPWGPRLRDLAGRISRTDSFLLHLGRLSSHFQHVFNEKASISWLFMVFFSTYTISEYVEVLALGPLQAEPPWLNSFATAP